MNFKVALDLTQRSFHACRLRRCAASIPFCRNVVHCRGGDILMPDRARRGSPCVTIGVQRGCVCSGDLQEVVCDHLSKGCDLMSFRPGLRHGPTDVRPSATTRLPPADSSSANSVKRTAGLGRAGRGGVGRGGRVLCSRATEGLSDPPDRSQAQQLLCMDVCSAAPCPAAYLPEQRGLP